jgi:hypothetical protein
MNPHPNCLNIVTWGFFRCRIGRRITLCQKRGLSFLISAYLLLCSGLQPNTSTNPSNEAFRGRRRIPWRAISSQIGAYRDGSVEVAVGFLPWNFSQSWFGTLRRRPETDVSSISARPERGARQIQSSDKTSTPVQNPHLEQVSLESNLYEG